MTRAVRGVQSIEVGSRVLDALVTTGEPTMLRDIAKIAGVAPAQAHAYLVSYRKGQLVEQDEVSGRYRLGPMALQLGIARMRTFDPFQAASEGASSLAAETGLTVIVCVWGTHGPTIVQVHEGADHVIIATRPGTVYSVTGTATGRVFAAFLPKNLVTHAIKDQRSERARARYVGELVELKAIQDDIDSIRKNGYAIAQSSPIPNVNAVGAPVFEVGGRLNMVVTLIGEAALTDVAPGSETMRKLVELARKISVRCGFFEFADAETAPPVSS